jgi:hypothetical protein
MKDSVTLRSEHLSCEISCHRDEGTEGGTHYFVSLHFEDGEKLTFCGGCVSELLDLLTRVDCVIRDRMDRS